MKGKLAILLCVACILSFALYQIGESNKKKYNKEILLNGTIVSKIDKAPIKDVTIAIRGNNPKTMTDENGNFAILVRSSAELIFKHTNYKSAILKASEIDVIELDPK